MPEYLRTAAPVNHFVAPARPVASGTNSMLDLADALSSVRPQLREYLIDKRDEGRKEGLEAGREARLKNKMAFKEAVKQGLIEPGQSPWFVRGYEEQSARIAGQDFDVALRNEYASSAVRNSNDPVAYREWVQDFRTRWMEEKGVEGSGDAFRETFLKSMEAAEANLAAHHAAARQQGIVRETVEATNTEVSNIVSNGLANGMDPKDLGAQVGELLRLKMDEGLHGSDANQAAIAALSNLAVQTRDEGVLDVLDHIPTGSGVVGSTAKAQEARLTSILKIGALHDQEEDREWNRYRRNKHLLEEQAEAELWQALLSGQGVGEVVEKYETSVPGVVKNAMQAERALREYQEQMTPEELREAWQSFDGTHRSISRMVEDGLLRDPSLVRQFGNMAFRLRQEKAEDQSPAEVFKAVLDDDFYKQGMGDIEALFRGELGAITDPIRRAEASVAFQRFYLQWALSEEGLQTTNPLERQRTVFDIYKRVADRYNPTTPGKGAGAAGTLREAFGEAPPTGYAPRGGADPETFRAFPTLPELQRQIRLFQEGRPNLITQWAESLGLRSPEEIDGFIQRQIRLLSRQ